MPEPERWTSRIRRVWGQGTEIGGTGIVDVLLPVVPLNQTWWVRRFCLDGAATQAKIYANTVEAKNLVAFSAAVPNEADNRSEVFFDSGEQPVIRFTGVGANSQVFVTAEVEMRIRVKADPKLTPPQDMDAEGTEDERVPAHLIRAPHTYPNRHLEGYVPTPER